MFYQFLLSIFPLPRTVYAAEADVEKFKKSVETVKESTENLKDILSKDADIKTIIDTFEMFSNVITTVGSMKTLRCMRIVSEMVNSILDVVVLMMKPYYIS